MNTKSAPKPNNAPRAKSAARLYAVQATYQMIVNDQTADQVVDDFLVFRIGGEPELKDLAQPEGTLFRAIVSGAGEHRAALSEVIGNHLKEGASITGMTDNEPLLLSILLCGGYELMSHTNIDAPIIISDYLNITHAYYQGSESRIINAILDAMAKLYR